MIAFFLHDSRLSEDGVDLLLQEIFLSDMHLHPMDDALLNLGRLMVETVVDSGTIDVVVVVVVVVVVFITLVVVTGLAVAVDLYLVWVVATFVGLGRSSVVVVVGCS